MIINGESQTPLLRFFLRGGGWLYAGYLLIRQKNGKLVNFSIS